MSAALLAWLVSVPLLGALIGVLGGGRWPAMAALVANLVLAAMLLAAVQTAPLHYALGGWEAPLGIALQADTLGAMMVGVCALVSAVVGWHGLGYFTPGTREERGFWPLLCLLLTALNVLFLSADAFNLYIGLEILSLAAVALVTLSPRLAAIRAALRYLLVSLIGSLCYLLGVALLYHAQGTLDLTLLAARVEGSALERAALMLMIAGLLLKTALFPLHFWLPQAHAGAPAPVSALLSALVLKGTFYLILRLWFEVLPAATAPAGTVVLGALGVAAILWGSLKAIRAPRLKELVAYSTVAQIGYLFALFPLLGSAPSAVNALGSAVYFVLAHACAKAALFLAAGNVLSAAGHDRLADLRAARLPSAVTLFALAIAGVSLIGLPPTGGFVAKWLMLQAALQAGAWWLVVVALVGGLLAAVYVFRVLAICFDGTAAPTAAITHQGTTVPAGRQWSALLLALGALALGLLAAPLLALLDAPALIG